MSGHVDRIRRLGVVSACAALAMPASAVLLSSPAAADTSFSACSASDAESQLATAMAAGGTITFACSGTITFTSPIVVTTGQTVTLDGTGQSVVFDGGGQTNLFDVQGGSLTLDSLTLTNAKVTGKTGQDGSQGEAGADGVDGQTLSAGSGANGTDGTSGNAGVDGAKGNDGIDAKGGAMTIEPGATVSISNSSFTGDSAVGGDGGGGGDGGEGGAGGRGGAGASGSSGSNGGAAGKNGDGGDGGKGGDGGDGGSATGGAIYNAGSLTVVDTTFSNDTAQGGTGGDGGGGGAGGAGSSPVFAGNDTYIAIASSGGAGGGGQSGGQGGNGGAGGQPGADGSAGDGGDGGNGGAAQGGGIFNAGTLSITGGSFTSVAATAGSGGQGGAGADGLDGVLGGGGGWGGPGAVEQYPDPCVPGGPGGDGGNGSVGGDAADGGAGGKGGDGGNALGGAIYNLTTLSLSGTALTGDTAGGGPGGQGGSAGAAGDGGTGGNGGYAGGQGNDVYLLPCQGSIPAGGTGGNGGDGGAGGNGGDGGDGGSGQGGTGGALYSTSPITQSGLTLSSNAANGGAQGPAAAAADAGAAGDGGSAGLCFCFYPDLYTEGQPGKLGTDGQPGTSGTDGGQGIGSYPDLFVGNTPTLVVTTPSLPSGLVGTAYQAPNGLHLAAAGGTQPYTWQVTGGALPPGLSLSSLGVLTGTPTINGIYQFTVQVVDSSGTPLSATATFALDVNGITLTPPAAPAGSSGSASGVSSDHAGSASAALGGISVAAPGAGAFTVATYGSNPVGTPQFTPSGAYFDLAVASGSAFDSISVQDCALLGGQNIYWWTGAAWAQVSQQAFGSPGASCTTMTISPSTTPSMSQLGGTVFGVAIPYTTPGVYHSPWNSFIDSIVCPSSTSCLVQGDSGSGALVTLTNGAPDAPQNVGIGNSQGATLACATATLCYAVGTSGTVPITDGQAGTVDASVPGIAVACESSSTCWVVDANDNGVTPIVDGTVGTPQPIATPGGLSSLKLEGIACPSATLCYVVGYGGSTLSATGVAVPIASDVVGGALTIPHLIALAIGCSDGSTCDVVGTGQNGAGFAVITNGTAGAEQDIASIDSELNGITCPTTTTCIAVGDSDVPNSSAYSGVVVPITNGVAGEANWPEAPATSFLYSIACPTVTDCIAVGFDSDSGKGLVVSVGTGLTPPAPPPLTITANDQAMLYGGTVPLFSAAYAGFRGGDSPSSLSGTLQCQTTATSSSPPGPYPITCSGQSSPDYTVSYVAGTLTVFPAPLTITADDKTIAQGDPLPSFTASYGGFVNGDTSSSLTTPPTCDTTASSSDTAGTFTISCSGAVDPDYAIVYVDGTLTITSSSGPPSLVITASDTSMPYGGPLPSFGADYTGFVNGDTAASLTTVPTCDTTATTSSPAGTYAITCSGAVDDNYSISYVGGTLTIDPVPLLVTAQDASMPYGGPLPSFGAGYTTFVNGDTAASLTTAPSCGTSATASSPAGQYAITCSGAVDPNYTTSYAAGTLTVDPVPLTITADDKTMVEGGPVPGLTATYSGLVNGDGPSSLTTEPTCHTTATSKSPPGTYPVTCSGAADANYSIAYVGGTMTVVGKSVTGKGTYSGPTGTVTFSFSMKAGTAQGSASGSLTLSVTGQWQLTGSLTGYTGTSPTAGSSTGTGTLSVWNATLRKGKGGWQQVATNVPFAIGFSATGATPAPGSMGTTIVYSPSGAQPALPNSSPQPLASGSVKIT